MTRTLLILALMTMWAGPAVATDDAAGEIRTARELLDALETADRDLRTLEAAIRYERRQVLQGDVQIRWGDLYFSAGEGENTDRVFSIRFQQLQVGDRKRADRQDWIFNGEWLIERRPDQKQYIARQIAPPDADFDPLRIGEGPLPIPIGQRAEDVLARYNAELVEPTVGLEEESGGVHSFVEGTHQLVLTPRRSDDDEFRQIRLWYTRDTLLPRLARTENRTGDVSFVQIIGQKVNRPLPEGVFDIQPPRFDEGWDVEIKEFDGA